LKDKNNAETNASETEKVSGDSDGTGTEVTEEVPETETPDELTLVKDRLLRQAAEYDNYRKRTAKERMELVPEITAKVVTSVLPVIDSVERALKTECSDGNYKKGVEMIYESFLETLKNLGVEESHLVKSIRQNSPDRI